MLTPRLPQAIPRLLFLSDGRIALGRPEMGCRSNEGHVGLLILGEGTCWQRVATGGTALEPVAISLASIPFP